MTICWHFNWKPWGLISNREQIHQQQTYGYITVLNVPVAWKLDLCIGVSCTYKVFYSEQQLQQWHLLNKSINILLNERLELLALAVIEKLYITNSYLHTHLNMVFFFLHTFNHKMHVLYMHRNIQSWKRKPNPAVPGVTTWGQKQVNLQRRRRTKQRYIPPTPLESTLTPWYKR